jgi:two-component system, OmpR family, KDP operon response regulator KdpE
MAQILVAEDDELTRFLLKLSLEQSGHEVIAAANGREALQQALTQKPDVLVLDLMMPGINGTEVIRQLRSMPDYKSLRIIVVTGTANPHNIPEAAQADVLLQKPVPIEELLQHIKAVLE